MTPVLSQRCDAGRQIKTGRNHALGKTGGRVRPGRAGVCVGGAGREPYHLRIGWVVAPADLSTLMFLQPDLAPHAGKTYIPELTHFAGTPAEMQAMATGDLDTAALAFSTFALGIVNAGMDDLRVLGDEFQDGVPGYHTNDVHGAQRQRIKTVEDLKGKVLATNQVGSAVDMALLSMLAKHHLQDKRDVTIIEVRFPDMKAMLSEHKVDLDLDPNPVRLRSGIDRVRASAVHPGRGDGPVADDRAGRARRVYREAARRRWSISWRTTCMRCTGSSTPRITTRRSRWRSQATKQKPEMYQRWFFTKDDYYRDPSALPNLDALQQNIELQQKLGFLRKSVDVPKYADLSLVKEAAARLGK